VLVVQGQQDPASESIAAAFKAPFTNVEVVLIPKAGHNPWLEQPKVLETVVSRYLDEKAR
jgi:pimeloyl-ACP methyl ester carboxylesterase